MSTQDASEQTTRALKVLVTLVLAAICSLNDFRQYLTCNKQKTSLSDNVGKGIIIQVTYNALIKKNTNVQNYFQSAKGLF